MLSSIGCAGIPSNDAVKGAVTSLTVAGIVTEVQEAFTPVHPLYLNPIEICSVDTNPLFVQCTIVPCKTNCVKKYSKAKWITDNPYVSTMLLSNIAAIKKFCLTNKDVCITYIGAYKGETIIIQKDK